MERKSYIPDSWDLPDSIRKRLGVSVGKQRIMDEDGHLLLLLHAPPTAADDEVRGAVVFWRDPRGAWASHPVGGGLAGLEKHLASYRKVIHGLDEKVDNAKCARDYFDVMRDMHPMQRSTRSLLNVMQEAREARPDESRLISLRDQAADLERAIELIAADAKAGMDFTVAETSSKQAVATELANHEARRLNRLAAFFFPLVTLVSVFGMNAPADLLGNDHFWIVLLSGILLGVIVHSVVAVKKK
ncbi:MAG: hypothetical protein WCS43_17840 [Verrucomicrobiota bacterium]